MADQETKPNSQPKPQKKVTFAPGLIIDSIGPDGKPATTYTFFASDGETVSSGCTTLDSEAKAAKLLEQLSKQATRIVARDILKDKNGKKSGQRIVLIHAVGESPKQEAKIIRTNGRNFCVIASGSLEDALQLEKQKFQ